MPMCKRRTWAWVCKNHPDRPWSKRLPNGCECGAGAACPDCNAHDPPARGQDDWDVDVVRGRERVDSWMNIVVGVAFILRRKKHHRRCYGALSMSNLLKMVAAAALFAGSATLAIAQTSPPDKSKSEAGAPQQGPGQEVPKAGTGTGAGTGETAMPAPGTPPNPTGITQEKQKSEANDPQQGGKKN